MLKQQQRQSGTRGRVYEKHSRLVFYQLHKRGQNQCLHSSKSPGAQYAERAEPARRNSLIINVAKLPPSFHNLGPFVLVL
jgi:hypothetical protein